MEKALLGTLLGLAVGGGIYGLYVNYGTRMAMTQMGAKELLEECALLQVEQQPDPAKIEAWLNAAREVAPEVFAVNTIVGGAFNDQGAGSRIATQVDSAFRDCARILQGKISSSTATSPTAQ